MLKIVNGKLHMKNEGAQEVIMPLKEVHEVSYDMDMDEVHITTKNGKDYVSYDFNISDVMILRQYVHMDFHHS